MWLSTRMFEVDLSNPGILTNFPLLWPPHGLLKPERECVEVDTHSWLSVLLDFYSSFSRVPFWIAQLGHVYGAILTLGPVIARVSDAGSSGDVRILIFG